MLINMWRVYEFHKKFGFTIGKPLVEHKTGDPGMDTITRGRLRGLSNMLHTISEGLKEEALHLQSLGDERMYRTWLSVEELAEQIEGYSEHDEIKVADACADKEYVNIGDAILFGIPLAECYNEVHASNMTKVRTEGDRRMRSKNHPGYKKPDIATILQSYRDFQRMAV